MKLSNESRSGQLVSAGALLALVLAGPAAGQMTSRVSVDSGGVQGDNASEAPSFSDDGRYVVFKSAATNLVPSDTNNEYDVFVHDRQSGTTERVSVDSGGAQGNNSSWAPSISADGRYVAFASYATNLVVGDTNNHGDVFVHDRQTGTTQRVSVSSGGVQGNGHCGGPSISVDARFVAFGSYSTNLVGGDTNSVADVFVHDRQSGTTERVSVDSGGAQGNGFSAFPSVSADGRYLAFQSAASNLIAGDTNNASDLFVHDRQSGTTERVSISSGGAQGNDRSENPSISADGRYVAFESYATNLVVGDSNSRADVFFHDRQGGTTERVSVASGGAQGNNGSFAATISVEGRYVAFYSYATNLVSGDTNGDYDVFVHDLQSGTTERMSVALSGAQGNADSSSPSISADGRCVAFESWANNLVGGDTNDHVDVFLRDRGAEIGTKYCTANANSTGASADLSASGSASSGAGDLRLTSLPVPNQNGTFFHGANPSQVPFGNGFLCTTGGLVRGVVVMGLGNAATYLYDNSDAKHSLAAFIGSTRNFQHWFRDPAAGGAFFNTSNAMAIVIVP